jgi:fructose-1,6-bisphosphatase I/sedoheptulose-1,7-bisphosphatase
MAEGLKTLTHYTIEEEHRHPGSTGDFSGLLNVLATAVKIIANQVNKGALVGTGGTTGAHFVHGDLEKKLNVVSNDVLLQETQWAGHVAAMASEEMDDFYPIPSRYRRGKYLLAFDPLDGSSNLDVNMSLGTIFSVLRSPDVDTEPSGADFLQPGAEQVCAGFALYGPSTMLVLTTGAGVDGFTLDREIGAFVLTHPQMRIPQDATEFAINACNGRFWEQPVKRYVQECLDGAAGPRDKDFTMRWVASLVADTFRILTLGGLYLDPCDAKEPDRAGGVQQLYQANPIAFIIEQAGGAASTGHGRLLDLDPAGLHQRVPMMFGSKNEVERIERYHREFAEAGDGGFDKSLFTVRSLFRTN